MKVLAKRLCFEYILFLYILINILFTLDMSLVNVKSHIN